MGKALRQYQQGDVIARQVTALPTGVQPRQPSPRGIVLAEGEVTGHAHVAVGPELSCYEKDGLLYLVIGEGGAGVQHEEHAPQQWAPGIYEIDRVREKDYLADMVRQVKD